MGYKIVFCDVDGTLLNSRHRMLDSTLKAIHQLQAKGIFFVIVTARGPSGIYPIFKRYKFVCPMVCYSGALIIDADGTILSSNGFSKTLASDIINYIETEKFDCTWNVYSEDKWIVNDKNDARVQREEGIVEAESVEGSVELLSDGELVGKLLCMCNPSQTDFIEAQLKERFKDLSIMKSSDILIEIMNKGISKSTSVDFLCDKWNIDISDTVAFGDHYNDIDMLKAVAKPFLMENAPDELKDLIANVTSSNDSDGIYNALKKIGLIQ